MPLFSKSLPAATIPAVLLALTLLSGCGDDGPSRVPLWGKVTWKGQPVPRGVVYFGPDGGKGNVGPQGYALILDGAFDTRQSPGKGCVVGPHVAMIQGCSGQNISDLRRYGDQLFAPYEMSLEVSAEGGEMDLIIPDTVPAAPPSANEPE